MSKRRLDGKDSLNPYPEYTISTDFDVDPKEHAKLKKEKAIGFSAPKYYPKGMHLPGRIDRPNDGNPKGWQRLLPKNYRF